MTRLTEIAKRLELLKSFESAERSEDSRTIAEMNAYAQACDSHSQDLAYLLERDKRVQALVEQYERALNAYNYVTVYSVEHAREVLVAREALERGEAMKRGK